MILKNDQLWSLLKEKVSSIMTRSGKIYFNEILVKKARVLGNYLIHKGFIESFYINYEFSDSDTMIYNKSLVFKINTLDHEYLRFSILNSWSNAYGKLELLDGVDTVIYSVSGHEFIKLFKDE